MRRPVKARAQLALAATIVSGLALMQGCGHDCDHLNESFAGKEVVPDTKLSADEIVASIAEQHNVFARWAGDEEENVYQYHFSRVPFEGNEPLTVWVTMDHPVFHQGYGWEQEYGECQAKGVEAHATLHVRSKDGRLDEVVPCDLRVSGRDLQLDGEVDALQGTASSYQPSVPAKGRRFVTFELRMSPIGDVESLDVTVVVEGADGRWNYRPLLEF